MRLLHPISEPKEVSEYKSNCEKLKLEENYNDMPRKELRKALVINQGGLCAYCMSRIHNDEGRISDSGYVNIEHIIPENTPIIRKGYNSNTDVKNMLGVCNGNRPDRDDKNKHCDASRGGRTICVNPYNEAQMKTIRYLSDGTICSTDERVNQELNEVLQLNSNCNSLKRNRQTSYRKLTEMVRSMCDDKGIKQAQLNRLRNLFCQKDERGVYREFVGVYEYWLDRWEKKV